MMVMSPIPTNNMMQMIGSRMLDLEVGEFYGPLQASPVQASPVIASRLAAVEVDNSQLAMIIDDIAEKSKATSEVFVGSLDSVFGNKDHDLFDM